MRNINTVTISGRLGRDPELRSLPSGTELIEFSVAIADQVKKSDAWEDRTHWVRVTLFGRGAPFFAKHLEKGSFVVVSGKLNHEKWIARDGTQREQLRVLADDIDMGPRVGYRVAQPETTAFDEPATADDDIPF
jgi:single-strand DNA-binding protein